MVTGPHDAGKTRLVESVMRETEKNDRLWWLHINMRDPVHHWTSVESVYKSLLLTFTNAFYRYAIDAAKTTGSDTSRCAHAPSSCMCKSGD